MNHENHPCFSENAQHKFGRIHLPVAPRCNMQCNYCDRDFECVNESRPGVTITVLTPQRAAVYLDAVLERIKNIAVVGIAGPGDPFANPEETMETLRLVRQKYPEMSLCLATNGLDLPEYVDELKTLNIGHVTVTVNAVNPEVGRWIYAWARLKKRMYRGTDASKLIMERQRESIIKLKEKGITVKVNTVIIPGINDDHIVEIAENMAQLKADLMNCIPLYRVANTPFADINPPSPEKTMAIRKTAGVHIPQMNHCRRCRADAAGMLGEKQSNEIRELLKRASSQSSITADKPYVAVASMEGLLVNRHLGETSQFWIFGLSDDKAQLIDKRFAPLPGGGTERWAEMVRLLHDCNTVLASGVGTVPQKILEGAGIRIVVMEGLAREGVEAVLTGGDIPKILLRTPGKYGIGKQCTGTGTGCG